MCNCRVNPSVISTLPGDHNCQVLAGQPRTKPSNLCFTDNHLKAGLLLTSWYLVEMWTWDVLQCCGLINSFILLCFEMFSGSQLIPMLEHCNIKTQALGHLDLQMLPRHPPGMSNWGMVVQSLCCILCSGVTGPLSASPLAPVEPASSVAKDHGIFAPFIFGCLATVYQTLCCRNVWCYCTYQCPKGLLSRF